MSKQARSQWDFGELFPSEPARRVLTVSELTTRVKRALEKELGSVWVTGEVTNLRVQSSGHMYFTLKDAGAQLQCVLFRGVTVDDRAALEDGRKLVLQGDLTVYEPRGQYQLIVRAVELQGVGALQLAFERLKRKLQAEGLFARERKRPLPVYPQRIGLVTSPTGAAIRDVLHVIRRRNPSLEIILAPCRVQGQGAAEEIAAAIRLLNEFGGRVESAPGATHLDLILLTRGGGSLEDLWAFNEEVVARAIFESALPVVSAVGHEIDFTISDFVADHRAATPSAAAEIITEGVYACRDFLGQAPGRMGHRLRQRLGRELERVGLLEQRAARVHPRRRLNEQLQWLDELQGGLARATRRRLRECRVLWEGARQRLGRVRLGPWVDRRRQALRDLDRRLGDRAAASLKDRRSRLGAVEARLRLLSPLNVLERGYSITTDSEDGRVLRDAGEVQAGRRLKTRLRKGEVRSVVEETHPDGGRP